MIRPKKQGQEGFAGSRINPTLVEYLSISEQLWGTLRIDVGLFNFEITITHWTIELMDRFLSTVPQYVCLKLKNDNDKEWELLLSLLQGDFSGDFMRRLWLSTSMLCIAVGSGDCEGVGEGEDVILEAEVEGSESSNMVGNKATSWPENPLVGLFILLKHAVMFRDGTG
ncbi:hypothetical protein Tco_0940702 [Tanacetum coccineum]|uniref:Uncharacterized protein n=1 Tax=Tanacetum coccineum TaxID=301880 RepID=A0ABQ5DPG6_9ASTR